MYSIENIREYPNYENLCKMFIELAKDSETKNKLESILYNGKYKNYPQITDRAWNIMNEIMKRVGLAHLIINNPETFDKLVEGNITFFRGAEAVTLKKTLNWGLYGRDYPYADWAVATVDPGIESGSRRKRMVIFTDVLDMAEHQADPLEKTKETELAFPIIYGVRADLFTETEERFNGNFYKRGTKKSISAENISCILTPSDKVDTVRKMVDGKIPVFAADGMNTTQRFYYIDESDFNVFNSIHISYDKYEKLKTGAQSVPAVSETVKNRPATGIRKIINLIARGKKNGPKTNK